MQWVWRVFGERPRLAREECRVLCPGVEDGPRRGGHRDAYERTVAWEEPGEPAPGGPHRRVAEAILCYRIFPPHLVTGILRREPLDMGDTVGIGFRLVPGVELLFAARVTDRFDRQADG